MPRCTRATAAALAVILVLGLWPARLRGAIDGVVAPRALAAHVHPSAATHGAPRGGRLEPLGQAGGRFTTLALDGDRLVCGQGARLRIGTLEGAGAPTWLGQTGMLGERVADVVLAGALAYVAAGYDGLQLVDVSDGSAPVRVGGTRLDAVTDWAGEHVPAALRVSVAGGVAAVVTGVGAQWVDVSDPTKPRVVGAYGSRAGPYEPDAVRDVSLLGRHALVAQSEDGFVVLDLARPEQPVVAARLTDVRPRAIAGEGTHAFLALEQPPGLLVLDVADPARPVEIARLLLQRAPSEVWVAADRAYLAYGDAANGLPADGPVVGASTVSVIDVSRPEAPRDLGLIELDDGEGYAALAFADGFGLVAGPTGSLRRVDLADAQTRVAGWYDPGWYHTEEMAIRDGWLYALDGYGQLQVLELAVDGEPGRLRTFSPGFAAVTLALGDGRAYLGRAAGGLAVLDTSDPARPRVVGTPSANWRSEDLAAEGSVVVAATGHEGLRVVDVADPARPVEVAGFFTSGPQVHRVGLTARHAHVLRSSLEGHRGVEVVDLSEPASPRQVGAYASDLTVWDLATSSGRSLVTGRTGERRDVFELYDVSDPAQPRSVGPVALLTSTPGAAASHVALEWPYAGAVDHHELAVRDLSEGSEALRRLTGVNWPGLYGLALGDGFAYAGHAWARGYTVLRQMQPGDADGPDLAYRRGSPGATSIEAGDVWAWALAGSGGDAIADALELLDARQPAVQTVRARYVARGQILGLQRFADVAVALVSVLPGAAQRLEVLKAGDDSSIEPIGALELGGQHYYGLAVDRDTAWLLGGSSSVVLARVDLSEATLPTKTWSGGMQVAGAPRDVAAADGRVVVLTTDALAVLDGADPAGSRAMADCPGSFDTGGLAVADGRAYTVTSDGRVAAADTGEPFACHFSGEALLPSGAQVVTASERRLYVGRAGRPYLGVLDVAEPAAPVLVRTERLWEVHDAAVTDGLVWLATGATGVVALEQPDGGAPQARDLTRAWPQAGGIDRDGDLVAVAAGSDGLRLLSIADRRQPTELGAFAGLDAADVALVGTYAYVASRPQGLVVLDVSDPARVRETARLELDGAAGVRAGPGLVYVMREPGGLAVVDARDPASPALLGELRADDVSGRLAVSADGRLAITSTGAVIDLSDPTAPGLWARIDGGGWAAADVALVGARAYLDGPAFVYDLTDPTHPLRIGEVVEPSDMVFSLHRLAVAGRWLFAAGVGASLLAYDLADPDHIAESARYDRGAALAPLGDPWADGPERHVASFYADEELVLAGGQDDGLWVVGWSGPAVEPWRALLPTALQRGAVGAGAR